MWQIVATIGLIGLAFGVKLIASDFRCIPEDPELRAIRAETGAFAGMTPPWRFLPNWRRGSRLAPLFRERA